MGVIDTLKDVVTLVQKADNIELTKKIIGLQTDILAMTEENRSLRDKVSKLEAALDLRGKMHFEKDAYWMGDGRTEKDGPYCPRCYDIDGRPVRMTLGYDDFFRCPQCKTSVQIPGIKPPKDSGPIAV